MMMARRFGLYRSHVILFKHCVAVGVASREAGIRGVNASKRETLITAGADLIIPDYEHADELLAWLWGEQ